MGPHRLFTTPREQHNRTIPFKHPTRLQKPPPPLVRNDLGRHPRLDGHPGYELCQVGHDSVERVALHLSDVPQEDAAARRGVGVPRRGVVFDAARDVQVDQARVDARGERGVVGHSVADGFDEGLALWEDEAVDGGAGGGGGFGAGGEDGLGACEEGGFVSCEEACRVRGGGDGVSASEHFGGEF